MKKVWLYPECNLPVISNTYFFALSDELQGLPRLKGYEPLRNEALHILHSSLQSLMVHLAHNTLLLTLSLLGEHRAAFSGHSFSTRKGGGD